VIDAKPRGTKAPVHLLPARALLRVAEAFGHGVAKGYGRDSWKHAREDWRDVYAGAAFRHLAAILDGERLDDGPGGSGLPHAWHLGACALILIWHDDREGANQ